MGAKLKNSPVMIGEERGGLPNYTIYPVIETKTLRHAGQSIRFFKIRDNTLGEGWVIGVGLEEISQDCDKMKE